jgi:hypothetical protein
LAFAASRLNWSCPLKTVLNGNRDSYANATEQINNMGTKTLQVRISPTTQRGIALQSTRVSGLVFEHTAICHSDQSGGISLLIDFPFLASLADNDPAAAGDFARHDKEHIRKEFYFTGADLYRWHCANSFS